MRKMGFCVLVVSVVLFATNAGARTHVGKVIGQVLEQNGRPAAGAEVMLERADGSAPRAVRTDSSGRFLFKFVRAGLYDIRASHGNMATIWKHNVLVHAGKETSFDLRLEPIRSRSIK